jgi:hypothetical protein
LAFHVRVAEDVAGTFNVSVTFTVRVMPPPVTVMVAVLLPRLALAVFTLAVTVPLFEPDVGLTVNHVALSVTVQDPFDVTVRDWLGGLAAPWVAVKVRLLGDTVNEAAETVRVTLTVLVVPPPVTVIVAVFVPTRALAKMILAAIVPLPLPEVGLSVSQTASSLAVQLPFDVTVTDWLAGLEPPCTPV